MKLNKGKWLQEKTNSVNFMFNMFSNIYFLSHVYSKIKKVIPKNFFFCAYVIPSVGLSAFKIIFHSGK
jgi:hypothetical protein